MKKNAWTMVELTIAITIIVIMTAASMTVTKNMNANKASIYIYSTIRNIQMGNAAILEEPSHPGDFYPTSAKDADNNGSITTDWYCMHLLDSFSITGAPNCTKTTTSANATLSNGVRLWGLAKAWKTAYSGLYYKDILMDINGGTRPNKIGIDRFALRVFRGVTVSGAVADGAVYPVNLGNDFLYKPDGNKVSLTHDFKDSSSANFASDAENIIYEIYRVTNGAEPTKARIIRAGASAIQADCEANGSNGFYGGKVCKDFGFRINPTCAHEVSCYQCNTYGVCPSAHNSLDACNQKAEANKLDTVDDTTGGTYKEGYQCFAMIKKPTGGLGMIGNALIGDMGM